ncbi:MAG TPA: hypothetical protein PKX52_02475 [Methanomassiliicoccaceae archaeon]|jgi:hypothetical protein|nr:hypothetical protein [Euryarchaeota archaeon]HOB38268.1 hypothetical protein [Methanomassiliicoccaceae archaeon]HOL06760.1 hypothetical protein [Methanomassiliicoccaceae archaeon]HOQ26123.1 hypothetical protein [Methanomassiliicoccaceae archaeon]HPP45022.1 hypothetical protein [Methanomassiliicoccaceae archaeon]
MSIDHPALVIWPGDPYASCDDKGIGRDVRSMLHGMQSRAACIVPG